jgi:threonine dehydrogenase-like Zn-dependent dehydrogenase
MSLVKELSFINAIAYRHEDFADAAAMLASWSLVAETVVTYRFPLARAADAFRVAAHPASGAIKVVLQPGL